MDIIFDIIFDVYFELMLLAVPRKNVTKKYIFIARAIAVLVLFGLLALFLWGVILIVEFSNMLGLIPILFSVIISLIQIVFGIVLYKKNAK